MATFTQRVIGAARLNAQTYEEVEADSRATRQAVAVVLLAGVADGIGSLGLVGTQGARNVTARVIGALIAWLAWAALTSLLGARLLPESKTQATVGELLRTLGFAAAPGLLRGFGALPFLGRPVYVVASVWMLVAMVVAVRQALDYTSTARAVGVCILGWALSLIVAVIIGMMFTTVVS